MNVKEATVSHRLYGLTFELYSQEEIKKLSVKEITNPEMFDSIGHAIHGGSYDPALGPTDMNDICVTCGQRALHCPGHLGHIVLPMPVYNPLLFAPLIKILRISCFECHQLLCSNGLKELIFAQLCCLEKGHLTAVGKLQDAFNQILLETTSKAELSDSNLEHIYDVLQKSAQEILNNEPGGENLATNKNITAEKLKLFNEFLKGSMYPRNKCPHCKTPVRKIRAEQASKVYFSQGLKKEAAMALLRKKKKENDLAKSLKRVEGFEDTDDFVREDEDTPEKTESELSKLMEQSYLTPLVIKQHMRGLWKNDQKLLGHLIGALNLTRAHSKNPTDSFFMDVLPVAPSKFRPVMHIGPMKFAHTQSQSLGKILEDCNMIRHLVLESQQGRGKTEITQVEAQTKLLSALRGNSTEEKLYHMWLVLQGHINALVDSDLDKLNNTNDKNLGIKQIIEKKQGLFRKHMMGKRVNFAARSVISPDPFINTNEVGIPEVFAKVLTYPEPVTPWNFQQLKQAVLNGPDVHPGALFVENEDGNTVKLRADNPLQREAIAKQLLTPHANAKAGAPNKKVLRHIRNGDLLLLNRQPTLHKPSIQGHRARILKGEKTIRLHYANCKAYNADFDGDEMNAHFPQNELGRAEGYTIAATDYNYLVPKDGTPLAGLIQDHMIGGVTLSMRGRFFARQDYQQLVYSALTDKAGPVKTLPPAMIKPNILWSGKQVLSTVLLNIIPEGKAPLNITGKSKISHKSWQNAPYRRWKAGGTPFKDELEMTESQVVIRAGELLVGVLDKAHYGNTPYGLVHSCYELYGGPVAGKLLTALAKLFTYFLQLRGFTLGVADIVCTPEANAGRRKVMAESAQSGHAVAAKAMGLPEDVSRAELELKMREAHFEGDGEGLKDLDLSMKGKTDEISNAIVKKTMPVGLQQKFPENNLQLMVNAGAKGSSVNCMQISCLLGQIELEGRRPPLMISGQGLPSFKAYDTSPRAGGFIDGRFLTGIRPQEYFYHCMAGREGLIDTAVKTSRSGYLQRCIVKHLEGILVNYDMTVRDADGSIIQFNYGEDSLDIMKTQFLGKKQFPFLIENKDTITSEEKMQQLLSKCDTKRAPKWLKKIAKWKSKHGGATRFRSEFTDFCRDMYDEAVESAAGVEEKGEVMNSRTLVQRNLSEAWSLLSKEERKGYKSAGERCPDPILSCRRPDRHFGAVSETLDKLISEYINSNPDNLLSNDDDVTNDKKMSHAQFRQLVHLRYMDALAPPGEPVGLVAAQSIGEPSTQMTLNTFHFAGRGEMNVTLGIPRLREILLVASSAIRTPAMDIPVLPGKDADAQTIKLELNKVRLNQVLQDVNVTEYMVTKLKSEDRKGRNYRLHFRFLPYAVYREEVCVNPVQIVKYMENVFFNELQTEIKKRFLKISSTNLMASAKMRTRRKAAEDEDEAPPPKISENNDDENDIMDDDFNDGDATAEKNRRRQDDDEQDYDGEEEERDELSGESGDSDIELDMENEEDAASEASFLQEDGSRPGTPLDFSDQKSKKKKKKQKPKQEMDDRRINNVLRKVQTATNYRYDPDEHSWCEITLNMSLSSKKLDLGSLLEDFCKRCIVYQVPKINRALISNSTIPGQEGLHLKTDGVNIREMYKHGDVLALDKLYSNDIHAIANQYGIEAASKVIIKEMRDVFAAYGIQVNYHHLSLIADYMTFEGVYRPFNRHGLNSNPSPLQKMSFESTMNFLREATLQGVKDDLTSPSSRLVVGKVVNSGTGCFSLMQPVSV